MSAATKRMVRCPYCDEEIGASAKKGKHCGEWIDASKRPAPAAVASPVVVQQAPDRQYETIMLNVRNGGINTRATLNPIHMMVFTANLSNGIIIGHVTTPRGTNTVELERFLFNVNMPIREIYGVDLERAQKRLDPMLNALTSIGFQIVDRGPYWYSYTLCRT